MTGVERRRVRVRKLGRVVIFSRVEFGVLGRVVLRLSVRFWSGVGEDEAGEGSGLEELVGSLGGCEDVEGVESKADGFDVEVLDEFWTRRI